MIVIPSRPSPAEPSASRLRRVCAWSFVTIALVSTVLVADDDLDEFGEVMTELAADADWWHADWQYRMTLRISGPGLSQLAAASLLGAANPRSPAPVLWLSQPDPLLLHNSGRCRDGLTDLRFVDAQGQELAGGVVNYGRDDGSSLLWCRPSGVRRNEPLIIFLYYGNATADPPQTPTPAPTPPDRAPALTVACLTETDRSGRTQAPAPAPGFFASVCDVPVDLLRQGEGSCQVELATADLSRLCIRRRAPAAAFTAQVGNCTVSFPAIAGATGFTWQSQPVTLAAGPTPVTVPAASLQQLDRMILTGQIDWRPDVRDYALPVYLRFRVISPAAEPFAVIHYACHTPYSALGMLGEFTGYALATEFVQLGGSNEARINEEIDSLQRLHPERLVRPGQWSQWGPGAQATAYTWFTRVQLRPRPVAPIIECQFATRPDSSRVFSSTTEAMADAPSLQILMPTVDCFSDGPGLRRTMTFGQWAQQRFELVQRLGLAGGRGPKTIMTATMIDRIYLPRELEYVYKTCNWLGINAADAGYADQTFAAARAEANHITGTFHHPWPSSVGFVAPPGDSLSARPVTEVWRREMRQRAGAAYSRYYANGRQRQAWVYEHARFGALDDESQRTTAAIHFNFRPELAYELAMFREFLQGQGLQPDFFGVDGWDQVYGVEPYLPVHPAEFTNLADYKAAKEGRIEAAKLQLVSQGRPDDELDLEQVLADLPRREHFEWLSRVVAADQQRSELIAALGRAPLSDRRLVHWTSKFATWHYIQSYKAWATAARQAFPAGFHCAVNLQAQPMQAGQMWHGECNLFELGRQDAFDGTLLMEDWTGDPSNVGLALAMMRSAARTHNLALATYVVGHRPKQRILVNLAYGVRYFLFYLYGPVHRIGPVWAEDEATLREMGQALAQVGSVEADILAAAQRPADVAMLVSNLCEINQTYHENGFGRRRQGLYRRLVDLQIPVEVVSEEEIIADDALSRYRLLLVSDTHVNSDAQAKIITWLEHGGHLAAGPVALTRQEYDEPSTFRSAAAGASLHCYDCDLAELPAAVLDDLMTASAARRHVQSDCPKLFTSVHDGPQQTVLYLDNRTGEAVSGRDLRVGLPWRPTTVNSALRGRLSPDWDEASALATVHLLLPPGETEIIVFRPGD